MTSELLLDLERAQVKDPTPCGAETVRGAPYCPEHCARAYRVAGEPW